MSPHSEERPSVWDDILLKPKKPGHDDHAEKGVCHEHTPRTPQDELLLLMLENPPPMDEGNVKREARKKLFQAMGSLDVDSLGSAIAEGKDAQLSEAEIHAARHAITRAMRHCPAEDGEEVKREARQKLFEAIMKIDGKGIKKFGKALEDAKKAGLPSVHIDVGRKHLSQKFSTMQLKALQDVEAEREAEYEEELEVKALEAVEAELEAECKAESSLGRQQY